MFAEGLVLAISLAFLSDRSDGCRDRGKPAKKEKQHTSNTETTETAQAPAAPEPKTTKPARVRARRAHAATKKAKTGKKANHAKKAPKGAKKAASVQDGSKTAKVLDLLKRPGGASAKDLMKATGWQPHSVRGFLSGTINKKMGLTVISSKAEDGERSYSIKA